MKNTLSLVKQLKIHKNRVLVVSSDVGVFSGLEKSLPANYECVCSNSSLVAYDLIDSWKPEIVVVDMHVDSVAYENFCVYMRQNPRTCRVPIIILSSRNGLLEKYRCINAGASEFLHKPITGQRLSAHIVHFMHDHRLY